MEDAKPLVWLVTGTATGFGRSLVTTLLEDPSNTVIATLRNSSRLFSTLTHPNLTALELDVTSATEISSVLSTIKEKFGRLDVVVNNAGTLVYGEVEGTSEEVGKRMFEVNFWGSVKVTLAALDLFRDQTPRGGKVLQVSSKTGVWAVGGMGVYSATKFAIEGWYEALSRELDPNWNIQLSLILPGRFWTAVRENCTILPSHPAYRLGPSTLATNKVRRDLLITPDSSWGDPDKAVQGIVEVGRREKIPFRVFLGKDSIDSAEKKIKEYERDVEGGRGLAVDMYSDDLASRKEKIDWVE